MSIHGVAVRSTADQGTACPGVIRYIKKNGLVYRVLSRYQITTHGESTETDVASLLFTFVYNSSRVMVNGLFGFTPLLSCVMDA